MDLSTFLGRTTTGHRATPATAKFSSASLSREAREANAFRYLGDSYARLHYIVCNEFFQVAICCKNIQAKLSLFLGIHQSFKQHQQLQKISPTTPPTTPQQLHQQYHNNSTNNTTTTPPTTPQQLHQQYHNNSINNTTTTPQSFDDFKSFSQEHDRAGGRESEGSQEDVLRSFLHHSYRAILMQAVLRMDNRELFGSADATKYFIHLLLFQDDNLPPSLIG